MHTHFSYSTYVLRRQILALTGTLRFYDAQGNVLMFAQQKMFRLREDIPVYSDETKSQEILRIRARQVLDWSAAYDVMDSLTGEKVGVLRRKGWKSLARDEWEILDANEQPLGLLYEDNLGLALLRRLFLGSLLPQRYDLVIRGQRVATLRQDFHLLTYCMRIDFSLDANRQLDRRLGIAAAILLAIIEGKQSN